MAEPLLVHCLASVLADRVSLDADDEFGVLDNTLRFVPWWVIPDPQDPEKPLHPMQELHPRVLTFDPAEGDEGLPVVGRPFVVEWLRGVRDSQPYEEWHRCRCSWPWGSRWRRILKHYLKQMPLLPYPNAVASQTQPPIPSATAIEAVKPANLFCLAGDTWTVSFNGGPLFALPASPGCYFLSLLLASPGKQFAPYELRAAYIRFDQKPDVTRQDQEADEDRSLENSLYAPAADLGDVLERVDARVLRRKLLSLKQEIDDAQRSGDALEEQRLKTEFHQIAAYLNDGTRPDGKPRKVKQQLKKDRDVVRNAIDRTLEKIRTASPALSKHLKHALRLRNHPNFAYEPEQPTTWQL